MLARIIIGLYVLVASAALILMKLGSQSGAPISFINSRLTFNVNPVIILGGILYVLSFGLYTFLISRYSLGYIIPLGTGLVYILIFVASFVLFKEEFTTIKVTGICLIVAGLVFLNLKG